MPCAAFVRVLFVILLAGRAAALPEPIDTPEGPEPHAAVDMLGVAPADPGAEAFSPSPSADSPAIGAASETIFPGETLMIAGRGLAGARLTLWVEGQTFEVDPLRSSDNRMQAVVPARTAAATMFVWPVRGELAGRPIRVNGATLWWIWPCRIEADDPAPRIRLFGKNLSLPRGRPVVVIQPDHPGAEPRSIRPEASGPYQLGARLPDGLAPGRYRVWAHNGTGGRYGWSRPAQFEVVQTPPFAPRVVEVDRYDARLHNDTVAIKTAIADLHRLGGGILQFSARHYRLAEPIVLPGGAAIRLRGTGGGDWDTRTNSPVGEATVLTSTFAAAGPAAIELRGAGSGVEQLMLVYGGPEQRAGIRLSGQDQSVRQCVVVRVDAGARSACVESRYRGRANHEVSGCRFYFFQHGVRITNDTDYVRISDCIMRGYYSIGRGTQANAVVNWGGNQLIVEGCDVRSVDRTRGKLVCRTVLLYKSSIRNNYLADNTSTDVGPHRSVPGINANTGEQYLFHARGGQSGRYRIDRATADELVVDGESLPAGIGSDRDWVVFIAAGAGVGQWRTIAAVRDGSTIVLERPLRVVPAPGSTAIILPAFRHNLVLRNHIDAWPDPGLMDKQMKAVGVYLFQNCIDNIIAQNTMRNLGVAVTIATKPDTPSAWNLVRDNTLANIVGGPGDAAAGPVVFSETSGGFRPELRRDIGHWTTVGNAFRSNTVTTAAAAVQIGWRDFDRQWDQDYQPGVDRGLVGTVIENNRFEDVERGLGLSAPANWTLWRLNAATTGHGTEAPNLIHTKASVYQPLLIRRPDQLPDRDGRATGQ